MSSKADTSSSLKVVPGLSAHPSVKQWGGLSELNAF